MTNINASTELYWQVPELHACYADHFPDNPLVPGALLLKWIMALLEHEFHCTLTHIKQMKFLAPVTPGNYLTIQIQTNKITCQFTLTVYVQDRLVMNRLVMKGNVEYVAVEYING